MPVNKKSYEQIIADVSSHHVTLVAVSKTKSVEEIKELYDLGQKDFGENYVQELVTKQAQLPKDVRWHFIGHLQGNKVKQIAPFIHLIQSVDSYRLLQKINKEGLKNDRVIECLLQVHIAQEETKFGLDENELNELINMNSDEPASPAGRFKFKTCVAVVFILCDCVYEKTNEFCSSIFFIRSILCFSFLFAASSMMGFLIKKLS